MLKVMKRMLTEKDMHGYQRAIAEHITKYTGSGVFAEMGLGKSCSTLTAIDSLLNDSFEVRRVLIIAPLKVAQSVWKQEAAKWEHLKHLKFSLILGDERQRIAGFKAKAEVYVINRENIPWLVAMMQGKVKFDMLVIDESTSFKNHQSKRFKALKSILPAAKRVVILTGTPMPNTFLDLWAQVFLLDRGQRLGDNFDRFKLTYFEKDPYKTFTWNLRGEREDPTTKELYEKEIYGKIGDICISLKEEDYLKLPPRIDRVVTIKLPEAIQKKYDDFEKHEVLALAGEEEITAVNAAALTNKLLQFSNGAVYDEFHDYHVQHDEKLDRLEEIIEAANGQPVLIFYCYQHDLARIEKRLKSYNLQQLKGDKQVQAWNRGEIQVMTAHPASAGHGLNLQAGGCIAVWFGLNWNLEWYQQGNKRLHRQGQTKPVIIHHLLCEDTRDTEVLESLTGKADRQESLMNWVKAKIEKWIVK